MAQDKDPRAEPLGIIGAGAAGLITAHTLLQDGFTNVQLITRDKSPGGVWARERVYPGLIINNVHGEFRFSALQMPPPSNAVGSGVRLSGQDMCNYMESFAGKFLEGNIRYQTEVLNVRRDDAISSWFVSVEDTQTGSKEVLTFSRIVLCTGGCSSPLIPSELSPCHAKTIGFRGMVFHSNRFGAEINQLLTSTRKTSFSSLTDEEDSVVIVGGGKSAQDIAAYLASEGRKVSIVFETADAFLAVSRPLPDFIRKSRFLGILSPHIELRTRLERFLHTTWLGSKIVHGIWNAITRTSFNAFRVPPDSPLRKAHSLFWGIRTNDEGVGRPNGFYALVHAGKIQLEAPARVQRFGDDGKSVILNTGKALKANAVILATGYTSSWSRIFDCQTAEQLGIGRHPPQGTSIHKWDYTSLSNPPPAHPDSEPSACSIYRGIIPAKNIARRDLAINGAMFTTNSGYVFEVISHWISSYFLNDDMRCPSSPEEAFEHTERNATWLRRRFPNMLLWTNESYSGGLAFWTWPQAVDDLLEDMKLRTMRSGGNWLTWPFKVIDSDEISSLGEERKEKRDARRD